MGETRGAEYDSIIEWQEYSLVEVTHITALLWIRVKTSFKLKPVNLGTKLKQ